VPEEKKGRFQQIFAEAFAFKDVTTACRFQVVLEGCPEHCHGALIAVFHGDEKVAVVGMSNKPIELHYANGGVYLIASDLASRIHVSFCPD
jgi:hypothetical protein